MSSPSTAGTTRAGSVAHDLITLLEERGTADYIGESISQLEHSLQCAHYAKQAGRPDETIIAALLHDIGQFLPVDETKELEMSIGGSSVGRVGHEKIGEEYLRSLGFTESVCEIVGGHVAAKRYLTAIDSSYYSGLSDASKKSLAFQGGPFKDEELEAFERNPQKDEIVRVRQWDDMSKVIGIVEQTPRAETYKGLIKKHLEIQQELECVCIELPEYFQ